MYTKLDVARILFVIPFGDTLAFNNISHWIMSGNLYLSIISDCPIICETVNMSYNRATSLGVRSVLIGRRTANSSVINKNSWRDPIRFSLIYTKNICWQHEVSSKLLLLIRTHDVTPSDLVWYIQDICWQHEVSNKTFRLWPIHMNIYIANWGM
jgi:hypothetical protein